MKKFSGFDIFGAFLGYYCAAPDVISHRARAAADNRFVSSPQYDLTSGVAMQVVRFLVLVGWLEYHTSNPILKNSLTLHFTIISVAN